MRPTLFRHFSAWNLFFGVLIALFVLLCLLQRLILIEEEEEDGGSVPNGEQLTESAELNESSPIIRLRRDLRASRLEFGHLLPMHEYISAEQLALVEAASARYKLLRANGTRTIGMDYVDFFMPGEINVQRLDRDSLKRLQMQTVVDAMAKSGGPKVRAQIRRVIRRQMELREAKAQSESRHKLQTDAWDVCLGERSTPCNGHLGPGWVCACSLSPQHRSPPDPPACSPSLVRLRQHSPYVLSVVLLFPLPELLGNESLFPLLADTFLAHWVALSLHHSLKWDQVLVLRKMCLDDVYYALQFAFLKRPASEWPREGNRSVLVADSDLQELRLVRGGSALWMDQAVMERAFAEPAAELKRLFPAEMAEHAFYRSAIAQLGTRTCTAPWDYQSFARCHRAELLLLLSAAVLGLGLPLGAFRFYHRLMAALERRNRRRRESRSRGGIMLRTLRAEH